VTAEGKRGEADRPGFAEPLVVWALIGLVTVCVIASYSRLPVAQLYNVSRSGIEGGFSRALVLVCFPFALIAIALALIAYDRLRGRLALGLALASVACSAAVAWPGMVDQSDLDAKPMNAVPALGVALTLGLTVWASRRSRPSLSPRLPLDSTRAALAIVLVLAGLPWLFAEAGFSISHVPGLGSIFLGDQSGPGGGETLQAVHLGHHHGADGLYLVLSALLLSRVLPYLERMRGFLSAYVALMLSYGLANLVQDFWTEQVVKRGWTSWEIPSLLHPSLSLGWAAIVLVAALVDALAFRPELARTERS
jgi:hypothetical protein